ncbi:MAG: hypothetical protein WCL51_18505 [Bacteroidota bacterium]
MKNDESRDFTMFEGDMLEQAQRFADQFQEDEADFTTDYTAFETPFATEMQDAIDVCMATTSDRVCVGKQAEQTAKIEVLMETGRGKYQGGKLYVEITFPKDSAKLRTYGQPSYEAARASHVKLPTLMIQGYDMASDVDNKTKLIAEGFTLLKIEAIKTTADAITQAVRKQTKLKGARSLTTQERTINLNALWAMMVLISECSKKIYEHNPVMWNRYLLYPDAPPAPPIPTPPTEPTV